MFYNLAVFKSTEIHDSNCYWFAGRRSYEGAEIGAASRHSYPNSICVRDYILNRQVKIWETSAEMLNVFFKSFQCCLHPELAFPVTGCE